MNSATRVVLNLVSSTQGLFFVSAFPRNDLDIILTTDVLVVILTSKVLSPLPPSHGSLDEDGGHVQPVDIVKGHRHLLPR